MLGRPHHQNTHLCSYCVIYMQNGHSSLICPVSLCPLLSILVIVIVNNNNKEILFSQNKKKTKSEKKVACDENVRESK